MTREEVLAMEPGPQLNDLITHELMGYENDWSGSIAAAWEVVEKLRKDEDLKIVLEAKLFKGWYVYVKSEMGGNFTGMYEFDTDAPEAISKIALLSLI
jgi:hypothetical protein